MGWYLVQAAGAALVVLALIDVFLSVLYARSGIALLGEHLIALTWRVFRAFAKLVAFRRDRVLSMAGPAGLVVTISTWIVLLLIGFALIYWPSLGRGIQSSSGRKTPTDFISAIYVSGGWLTTAGNSELLPRTGAFRLLSVLEGILGISVITMTLAFLVEVYTALLRRNTLALKLHHCSNNSGDPAKLIEGLNPGAKFDGSLEILTKLADGLEDLYESHHLHSALLYFRFSEPKYALARVTFMVMDTVTLLRTALDDEHFAELKRSTALTQLWSAGMNLLKELARVFLPDLQTAPDDPLRIVQWRRRYQLALEHLRSSGIAVAADPVSGADAYVVLRRQWDPYVLAFAQYMFHFAWEAEPADPKPPQSNP